MSVPNDDLKPFTARRGNDGVPHPVPGGWVRTPVGTDSDGAIVELAYHPARYDALVLTGDDGNDPVGELLEEALDVAGWAEHSTVGGNRVWVLDRQKATAIAHQHRMDGVKPAIGFEPTGPQHPFVRIQGRGPDAPDGWVKRAFGTWMGNGPAELVYDPARYDVCQVNRSARADVLDRFKEQGWEHLASDGAKHLMVFDRVNQARDGVARAVGRAIDGQMSIRDAPGL